MTEKRFTIRESTITDGYFGKQYIECEYYSDIYDAKLIGYCTNPVRHKNINGLVLFYCQGSDCLLDTMEKWW